MSAQLLGLFVRYGTGAHGRRDGIVSDVEALHRHYRQHGIGDYRLVVVDNARPDDAGAVDEGRHWVIPGDNTRSEFSGWDRGLAFARRLGLPYDVVHLVTSTFRGGWAAYTRFVDERVVRLVARAPLAVGHIDAYNEPVELWGRRSQHWLRTAYVLLSREVVEALGSFVSAGAPEQLFTDGAATFRADAPLDRHYRDCLVRWLGGVDLGQGQVWHSAPPDGRGDAGETRRKLLAMLDEHMLSVRLREAGVRLVDAIWLGHNVARVAPPLMLDGWHPDWRLQLRERPLGGLALRAGAASHFESRLDDGRGRP